MQLPVNLFSSVLRRAAPVIDSRPTFLLDWRQCTREDKPGEHGFGGQAQHNVDPFPK
jgi:hypothetical protein